MTYPQLMGCGALATGAEHHRACGFAGLGARVGSGRGCPAPALSQNLRHQRPQTLQAVFLLQHRHEPQLLGWWWVSGWDQRLARGSFRSHAASECLASIAPRVQAPVCWG